LKDVYKELIESSSKLSTNPDVANVINNVKEFNDKLIKLHSDISVIQSGMALDASYVDYSSASAGGTVIKGGYLGSFVPCTNILAVKAYEKDSNAWKANITVIKKFVERLEEVFDKADVSGFASNNCANAFKNYIEKIVNKIADNTAGGIKSADRLFKYVCCQSINYDNDTNAKNEWIASMVKIMPVLLPKGAGIKGQHNGVAAIELAVCCPIDTLDGTGNPDITGKNSASYGIHKVAKTMAFDKGTIETAKDTLFANAMIPFALAGVKYDESIKVQKIANNAGFSANDVIVGANCSDVRDANSIKTFLALLGDPEGDKVKGIFFANGGDCYVNANTLKGNIGNADHP
jgi:hypothetical protein